MSQSDIKINLKFGHIQLLKIQYRIKKETVRDEQDFVICGGLLFLVIFIFYDSNNGQPSLFVICLWPCENR